MQIQDEQLMLVWSVRSQIRKELHHLMFCSRTVRNTEGNWDTNTKEETENS